MAKKVLAAASALAAFILLPVAIGEFTPVAPAEAQVVPAPGSLALLAVGLVGVAASRFRRRR